MCVVVLVANKVDLDERRVISTAAGEEFAQSKGLAYFECSAVSSVCCLFYNLLTAVTSGLPLSNSKDLYSVFSDYVNRVCVSVHWNL